MVFKKIRGEDEYISQPFKEELQRAKDLVNLGLTKNASIVLVSLTRERTQYELIEIFDHLKSDKKRETKKYKKKSRKNPSMRNQHKVAKGLSELREIELFVWDADNKLKDFLNHKYDLDWVIDGIIERTDNGKIIKVSNRENHVTLSLNNDFSFSIPELNSWKWKQQEYVTKVRLFIDDGRTDEFDAKMIGRSPPKLKIFKNRGWLNEQEVGQFPEHAKYKEYSLKVPFVDIIADLENQNKEAFDRLNNKVMWLKKLYNIQH